jgi:hypothetical protein
MAIQRYDATTDLEGDRSNVNKSRVVVFGCCC